MFVQKEIEKYITGVPESWCCSLPPAGPSSFCLPMTGMDRLVKTLRIGATGTALGEPCNEVKVCGTGKAALSRGE